MGNKPKKLRLKSYEGWYGPSPLPDEEVQQHLTITEKGRVYFSGYAEMGKMRTENFSIKPEQAAKILHAVSSCFQAGYEEIFATDVGSWELELTDENDTITSFRGSLIGLCAIDGPDLTDLIREMLPVSNLFVFGGGTKPDQVERFYLIYADETLMLDRKEGSFEYAKRRDSGKIFYHLYQDKDGVGYLLDILSNEAVFESDQAEDSNCRVTINYYQQPQKVFQSTLDAEGLPKGWGDFLQEVTAFISEHDDGKILSPTFYKHIKRKPYEVIYCSVSFYDREKTYYYQTEDPTFMIGDLVRVPIGSGGEEKIGKIESINIFPAKCVPYPLELTKQIIGKKES